MKICKDCKHYLYLPGDMREMPAYLCQRKSPVVLDLVTGNKVRKGTSLNASFERSGPSIDGLYCGEEGFHWEAKEED